MKTKNNLIGVRNLLIVLPAAILLLFLTDRLLPVFSIQAHPEEYNDNVNFMCLEKTPVENFLTVAEARRRCEENDIDISGYTISPYPLIGDMPRTAPEDENTVNIVVFGDSFVWGDNSLNRNELFWRQTELMLREKGYNCSVTAVGMAGANAYEEIGWYENYLKEHKPDLAVFGYVFNDPILDDGEDGDDEDAAFLPVLAPLQALFPNVYESVFSYICAKTMYSDKYGAQMEAYSDGILKGDVRAYYEAHFARRLDALVRESGVPAVVMTLPVIPGSAVYKALFRPLREIYADTAVGFYDSYEAYDAFYSARHKKNVIVNPGNTHPGSAAHYFYASYLTGLLERDYADVLGEKRSGSLQSGEININECTPCGVDLQLAERSEAAARYTLVYPGGETRSYLFSGTAQYRLTYPLGKGYIKLSFETPVDISAIELTGAPAGKTELYYTKINEKLGYDDNTLYASPLTGGEALRGEPRAARITSVCIHIDEDAALPTPLGITIYR